MKRETALIWAFGLSLLLAAGMSYRIYASHGDFEDMVQKSLKVSAGYDTKFLVLVEHLEKVLSTRAKFGYTGDKDPMTGKKRKLVLAKTKSTQKSLTHSTSKAGQMKEADPVRLTAIIAGEEENDFTAIMMDGDRSQSVSVGDYVNNRRVSSITAEKVTMYDDSLFYQYDIYGEKFRKAKVFEQPKKP